MKAGTPLPREGAGHTARDRAVLPSLVTAELAVYETMRARQVKAQARRATWHARKKLGAPAPRPSPQLAHVDYRRSAGGRHLPLLQQGFH
jgi:hypothetical protein